MINIGMEYERIRHRSNQCQRLTHDKERCPFNPSNRQAVATGGIKSIILSRLVPKISKDDPLFGFLTDDDVGIDPMSGKPKIASIGNKFSWAGERNQVWVQCKLYRALGNVAWFHLFPRLQTKYLERIGSDHRPIITRFVNENTL